MIDRERRAVTRTEGRIAEIARSVKEVENEIAAIGATLTDGLSSRELLKRFLEAEKHRDRVAELWRQRDVLRDELAAARVALAEAEHDLGAVKAAGPSLPLSDAEPIAEDPSHAPENETWEEALAKADLVVGRSVSLAAPDEVGPVRPAAVTRCRNYLNFREAAAIFSVDSRTIRNWVSAPSPLVESEAESPVVTLSEKARFIDADRLPDALLRSLAEEQRELIEQVLAVPMGTTRWAGLRTPEARIRAAGR